MYRLAHMGSSSWGFAHESHHPSSQETLLSSSCPVALKQNSILLECYSGFRGVPLLSPTAGKAWRYRETWGSRTLRQTAMWVSPSAMARKHSRFFTVKRHVPMRQASTSLLVSHALPLHMVAEKSRAILSRGWVVCMRVSTSEKWNASFPKIKLLKFRFI